MGRIKRLKAKVYEPEPLVISVQVEGKEVRYATWLQGAARFALISEFNHEYGAHNVRVLTEVERNQLGNNHGGRKFGKSFTEQLASAPA
jgi:hypothetical protein